MAYEFKFIKLPDNHGFDENNLKFLQTLDEGLVKSAEGISKKEDIETIKADFEAKLAEMKTGLDYGKLQKQIKDLYVEMAKAGLKPAATKEELALQEKEMNAKWIR